ncbi:uncharacterized protein Z518_09184 [Rhinocladiella mackenziei CBS 650.93]|uniref:Uncharacterized protein n=1 Tax=Rhinocladiella mackenziei CBS 650.93 TaxID=1442369 RepID=A0A0D2GSY2_9EURO|nr:uncharacterized protein Z518_09184 [Rhinocladiella mackenziei CBS 650.93]KIX01458.1 hypothetical protein Z518_09184 [Rhinocladiella mackenziei CBS 650.93]
MVIFTNVPAVTIGLLAKTMDNQINVNGVAGRNGVQVTKQLMAPDGRTDDNGFDVANGTTGWIVVIYEYLVVSNVVVCGNLPPVFQWWSLYIIATGHKSLDAKPTTSPVYIEYMFQTAAVPGGYFDIGTPQPSVFLQPALPGDY